MKRIVWMALGITFLAALTGCEHPYARLSTLQDPKYPVLHTSKIALPDSNAPTVDLATRLAAESLKEQLQALGFTLGPATAVPATEVDFQLSFHVTSKDEPVTYDVATPSMSTIVGNTGNGEVVGTVYTTQIVPHTHMVDMTELEVTLRRTQDPPVEVWSGRITAETSASEKYRTAFFRALLERIGDTAHGVVQLDSNPVDAKP